jgi:hypothetical protein
MSYFASLLRQITLEESTEPVSWPAILDVQAHLSPGELFGVTTDAQDSVVVAPLQTVTVTFHGLQGTMHFHAPTTLAATDFCAQLPTGSLEIKGSTARLLIEVTSHQHLNLVADWITLGLGPFLSVQIGVFVEVKTLKGTLGGRSLSAMYADGTYSALFAFLDEKGRSAGIEAALQCIRQDSPSYPRFTVASLYYHQALRLLSPHEISFVPYLAHAEVMLNLVKCLEILFGSDRHDKIRIAAEKLGFESAEIESQIVPIFILRGHYDVAHPRASRPDPKDVKLLRNYIDRSVLNVAYILRRASDQIGKGQLQLNALTPKSESEDAVFKVKLRNYLQANPLSPVDQGATTFTTGG